MDEASEKIIEENRDDFFLWLDLRNCPSFIKWEVIDDDLSTTTIQFNYGDKANG